MDYIAQMLPLSRQIKETNWCRYHAVKYIGHYKDSGDTYRLLHFCDRINLIFDVQNITVNLHLSTIG